MPATLCDKPWTSRGGSGNDRPWRTVSIPNVGTNAGSDRELPARALPGHVTRYVIAPGLRGISRAGCFRDGTLPIALPAAVATDPTLAVDRAIHPVAIGMKQRLTRLDGRDETETILNRYGDDFAGFETPHRRRQPWLLDRKETA